MTDREKVISELSKHIKSALFVDSDYVDCVRTELLQETVDLLKEREPVKPIKKGLDKCCGKCEKGIVYYYGGGNIALFCPACGQEVDWNE